MWLVLLFPIYGLLGTAADFVFYLAQTAVSLVMIPLFSSFTAVVYLDLRVRKENLNEKKLIAQLSR